MPRKNVLTLIQSSFPNYTHDEKGRASCTQEIFWSGMKGCARGSCSYRHQIGAEDIVSHLFPISSKLSLCIRFTKFTRAPSLRGVFRSPGYSVEIFITNARSLVKSCLNSSLDVEDRYVKGRVFIGLHNKKFSAKDFSSCKPTEEEGRF